MTRQNTQNICPAKLEKAIGFTRDVPGLSNFMPVLAGEGVLQHVRCSGECAPAVMSTNRGKLGELAVACPQYERIQEHLRENIDPKSEAPNPLQSPED